MASRKERYTTLTPVTDGKPVNTENFHWLLTKALEGPLKEMDSPRMKKWAGSQLAGIEAGNEFDPIQVIHSLLLPLAAIEEESRKAATE
ncbi:hypothetical protein GCM10028828_19880 [Corynebacterium tapiri]